MFPKRITLGDLIHYAKLKGLTDDTVVLVPGPDHSYGFPSVLAGTALEREENGRYVWDQDYGEELTPESTFGKRVPALIVG